MKKCLGCYEKLTGTQLEYHEKCSRKIFGSPIPPTLEYDLAEIRTLAKEVLEHRLVIPGVQPKLSLTLDKASVKPLETRLTIVGLWDGIFILKPPNKDYRDLPENEDVTMHMAEACGVKTAVHGLVRFRSGELAYISRRFDRIIEKRKIKKLHQEDLCQLTGLLTENKYNSSMEKVAKAVDQFTTNNGLQLVALFQLTAFSFLTGNADMHLKNFSILKNENNEIALTPAYDLLATKLAVPKDIEEMALTLNGKKNRLTESDFRAFATHCKMNTKATDNIFQELESGLGPMKKWIAKSFLSRDMKKNYLALIKSRARILKLKVPDSFT